jgi:hypothetical protein
MSSVTAAAISNTSMTQRLSSTNERDCFDCVDFASFRDNSAGGTFSQGRGGLPQP